ncbi:mycothiol transferase [Arthrobacter roseus]|uniref:mycothiol transferase n=1 Tax=Arthrobacter roseus TaxID=136274 RepID=UPI0019655B4D|nr:DinB family protein [Arthrobacter roseus]MBM7846957.1 hypothetical protein [Arthrobacter roseus]
MNHNELLTDAFDRVRTNVRGAVKDLTASELMARPSGVSGDGNSIAWLIWHLSRVQDDHMAKAAGTVQAYTADGWADRFALPFDSLDIGYGHDSAEVSAVRVESPVLLEGYYDAVHGRTLEFVRGLSVEDLDRVVDKSYVPAVTLGARIVSVIDDCIQHAGQAVYVRGLVHRG